MTYLRNETLISRFDKRTWCLATFSYNRSPRITVSNADIHAVGKVEPMHGSCHAAAQYSEMPLRRRLAPRHPLHCPIFCMEKRPCILRINQRSGQLVFTDLYRSTAATIRRSKNVLENRGFSFLCDQLFCHPYPFMDIAAKRSLRRFQ